MAILVISMLALFGNMYQVQKKYDYCKSIQFEGDYCKTQKYLYEIKKKKIKVEIKENE